MGEGEGLVPAQDIGDYAVTDDDGWEGECHLTREPQPRSRTVTIASIEEIQRHKVIKDALEDEAAISLSNKAVFSLYSSPGQFVPLPPFSCFLGEVVGPESCPPIIRHLSRHDITATCPSEVCSL